jgi:hypothetical protein
MATETGTTQQEVYYVVCCCEQWSVPKIHFVRLGYPNAQKKPTVALQMPTVFLQMHKPKYLNAQFAFIQKCLGANFV